MLEGWHCLLAGPLPVPAATVVGVVGVLVDDGPGAQGEDGIPLGVHVRPEVSDPPDGPRRRRRRRRRPRRSRDAPALAPLRVRSEGGAGFRVGHPVRHLLDRLAPVVAAGAALRGGGRSGVVVVVAVEIHRERRERREKRRAERRRRRRRRDGESNDGAEIDATK